jgi:hypothetical protein
MAYHPAKIGFIMPRRKLILATLALLFSALACRAATRLIVPDTPTPQPTTTPSDTPVPTLPPPTPTTHYEAACPILLTDIMEEAIVLNKNDTEKNTEEETHLVTYTFRGEKLHNYYLGTVPENLRDEQKDRATHEAIWNYFVALIPPEQRNMVTEFTIFTDGKDNYLAAVAQTSTDPKHWMLQVDILDSGNYNTLTYTLIHEHGHLLTLTADQTPPNLAVYNDPDDQDIYDREASACPQYFTGEGCSNPDSYINEFFNRFWTDFYEEWQEIDNMGDEDEYYDELDDFYETYQDQFLTDYAPTSPAEDIAESWTFFVLSPKPELNSIADEKILFFYEYPELVQLRQDILNRVCNAFPQ